MPTTAADARSLVFPDAEHGLAVSLARFLEGAGAPVTEAECAQLNERKEVKPLAAKLRTGLLQKGRSHRRLRGGEACSRMVNE